MTKIKLAFILFTNIRTGGGIERVLQNYIKYMPSDKFETIIIDTDWSDKQRFLESDIKNITSKAQVITVKRVGNFEVFAKSELLSYFISFTLGTISLYFNRRNIKKIFEATGGPDIIYLFGNQDSYQIPKGPYVIMGSNQCLSNLKEPYMTLFMKFVGLHFVWPNLNAFHLYPFNNKYSLYLFQKYNFALANGVDTSSFYPVSNRSWRKIRFLFVGRLVECKGVIKVIEAWNSVKDKIDAELTIVGRGPLERIVREEQFRSNFTFIEGASDLELAEIYRNSDILVVPSVCDSFNLTVLEGISSGLFILASNSLIGKFDDAKAENFLSYIDPIPKKISEGIFNIYGEYSTLKYDRQKAHMFCENKYSWKSISSALYKTFIQIYNEKK